MTRPELTTSWALSRSRTTSGAPSSPRSRLWKRWSATYHSKIVSTRVPLENDSSLTLELLVSLYLYQFPPAQLSHVIGFAEIAETSSKLPLPLIARRDAFQRARSSASSSSGSELSLFAIYSISDSSHIM
jgi:hypothetical protein